MNDRARSPIFVALPHISGLVIAIGLAVAIGKPLGWIGGAAALGPLVAVAIGRATRRDVGPWREAWAFGLVAASLMVGGYAIVRLPNVHTAFAFFFPVGLLAFLLGTVNFVTISISRTYRAVRGRSLNYPWIPRRLGFRIGIHQKGDGHGDR